MKQEKLSNSQSRNPEEEIARLERRLARERAARFEAEKLLETKSLDLYKANTSLEEVVSQLKMQVSQNQEFLAAINDFGTHLLGKTDLNEMAQIITANLIAKYDLEDCVIYKVEGDYCYQLAAYGNKVDENNQIIDPIRIKVGEGIVGAVAQIGKAAVVNDTLNDTRYIMDDEARRSELAVPILFENRVIGVIDSEHSQPNFYTPEHLRTISTIANLVSIFFKNSMIQEENIHLEEGLEQRSQILNNLIDNLHSGLLLNDEEGKIAVINNEFRRIFGIRETDDKIIGMDQRDSAELVKHLFVDPDEFMKYVDYCRAYNEKIMIRELEMKNGVIVECDFIPIYSGDHFIGQLWQVSDVTMERRSQQKIEESEEKYRGIIENMQLGLMEVDTEHRIVRAYDWFCDMTGYRENELIGKDARDVFLTSDYQDVMNDQDDLRASGRQSIYEIQMRKKSGELMWVMISGAPIYDQNGEITGSIGIHYDITYRRELEEELREAKIQADNAREAEKQFLANMSHEIRNPLNAIIGLTNLLYDTQLTSDQLKHLDGLKYSSNILFGLISGVLDISKIESGQLELVERSTDIGAMVDVLLKMAEFNQKSDSVTYENHVPKDERFQTRADPTVLNQIFLNLLNNATKFTRKGSIRVEGKFLESSGDRNHFLFTVRDTGIGIAPDRVDDIFETFKQADKETKLKYGGTGLGLAIVRKLVEKYDGSIAVESEEGKGSAFVFDLWLKPDHPQAERTREAVFRSTDDRAVLIVDDNELNRQYLTSLLSSWNLRFDSAENGEKAVKLAEKNPYDIILMDIRMPVMDGYEATIHIRSETMGKNAKTPIVALTASALVDEREKALNAGMNFHLTKPFVPGDLAHALSQFGILHKTERPVKNKTEFSKELDHVYLDEFYQGDMDRARIMFALFLETIGQDFDKLLEAYGDNDLDTFKKQAHKMKPNFSMVGLTHLTELMKQVESVASIEEPGSMDIEEIKSIFSKGLPLVQKEFDRLNT